MQTLGPTSPIGAPATANDQSAAAAASAPEASAAAPVASVPSPVAATGGAAVQVSISEAAQAYLSQPNPPSISEIQREKKKPKMKSLLEHMLEWARKYEEQSEQAAKDKQLAPKQSQAVSGGTSTASAPASLVIKKGADRVEPE